MTSFLQPDYAGHPSLTGPSLSFLIEHQSGKTVVFDLGVRHDWQKLPSYPKFRKMAWGITVQKDVARVLEESKVDVANGAISSIILSHHHWDHTEILVHSRPRPNSLSVLASKTLICLATLRIRMQLCYRLTTKGVTCERSTFLTILRSDASKPTTTSATAPSTSSTLQATPSDICVALQEPDPPTHFRLHGRRRLSSCWRVPPD